MLQGGLRPQPKDAGRRRKSKGHVDCIEIIRGNAKARAIPIVDVRNETAQITHEASVGRINEKELETLMARGLNENQAIDLIITGMLK